MAEEPSKDARRYDLFTRDGKMRLVWRLTDRGIAVEPDGLVLRRASRWTHLPYADIASVTLSTAAVGRSPVVGMCTISTRTGGKVVVSSTNASGVSDGARDGVYRRFVVDFHAGLVRSGATSHIAFHSGFSQSRISGLFIALFLATALFVVLPVILLLATGNLQTLWSLLFGAALLVPAYRAFNSNQPGTYNPGGPPDLLP